MDTILNKYIILSVGIFITVIIFASILFSFDKATDILGQVNTTNISIKDRLDDIVHKYDGAVLKGVDLVNALKTYEDNEKVTIKVGIDILSADQVDGIMKGIITPNPLDLQYYSKFDVDAKIESNNKYTVTFNKK